MSRRSPSTEYTTYAFTASSSIDYNYDPSGSTTKPEFDPYTDDYNQWHQPPDLPRRSPPPLRPPSPSPEYISESQKPSARLTVPAQARKLLILDLNGTLVYRSSHVRREFRHDAPPRIRIAHPRPYMSVFREYLFHPSTRAWLDTMVWSSAQPHSVLSMVIKCFGSQQDQLLAVWARDTLGLDERDYHRKAQTTKDLSKPWSKLPITRPSDPDTPQAHSAHTTLLMDDSPRKACLQPYNHLCIREYTGALRRIDLECLQRERRSQQTPNNQTSPSDTETISASNAPEHAIHPTSSSSQLTTNKKRKRTKKKRSEHAAEVEDKFDLVELGGYDSTLLAVVGVLERIKWEGNVAGWVRSGGLAKSYLQEVKADANVDADAEEYADGENSRCQDKGESIFEGDTSTPEDSELKHRRLSALLHKLTNGGDSAPSALSTALETAGETGQWFEDQAVLQFWVYKGVKALKGLGIQVTSGIVE
ncbi:hypothetical protein E4T56_gene10518 [Termitomyces sp. T112]|nr:hypothetical protein E4T56_gene10518 [Termitomyces sp. T112]